MTAKVFIIIGSMILMLVLVLLLLSTLDTPHTLAQEYIHYNFVVVLDLSDRIDPQKHPGQDIRDMNLIKSILSLFGELVRTKLYIGSKDRFQIRVAPQPSNAANTLRDITEEFYLDMSKIGIPDKRTRLSQFLGDVDSSLVLFYQTALSQNRYVGADIWGFFQNDLQYSVRTSKVDSVRNVVFILTDGYIQFDRQLLDRRSREGNRTDFMDVRRFSELQNWEEAFDKGDHGLIPIERRFDNLEVVVLEISPKDILNQRELGILTKYWSKWLCEMAVTKMLFLKSDYPIQQIENQITEFLQPSVKYMTQKK